MRINCIPVEFLTDQHLRAEWLEILMLPAYLERSRKSKNGLILSNEKKYTLGTGHARFFYDKLKYVENRYNSIGTEMKKRGFNANPSLVFNESLPSTLFNDWIPSTDDVITNLNRIIVRIEIKPQWYSHYKHKNNDWVDFYLKKMNYQWIFDESYIGNF